MTLSTISALAQLQALHDSFCAQLPGRVQALDMAWQGLANDSWSIEAARRMRLLLNNLTGSAGTFGFGGLSSASREADISLNTLIEAGRKPSSAQLLQMTQLLDTLKEAASTEQPRPLTLPLKATNAARNLIYIVGNDEGFALNMSMQLRVFGYDMHFFNGPEALKTALDQKLPAAILVDIMFEGDVPGTNARQNLSGLMPELPPLIFFSERDDFAARLASARAGGSGYFTKPVDISTLVDCLDYLTKTLPEEPYRILIVDDTPIDAAAHALHLQYAGFRTMTATDPMTVTAKIDEFIPDLILLNLNMPECNGIELAAVIRQEVAFLGTPIVFLSAETDRGRQLSAMKNGGDDFLTKPVKPSHLATLVQIRAGRGRILRSHMVRDSLTGVLNHNRVKEHLAAEVARAKRQKSQLTLAMINIDQLKSINNTHDHPAGDRVIKSLARLLQQRLRTTDIIGKFGGGEFMAILIGTRADQALDLMDDIRASFNTLKNRSKTEEFTASFSCGMASFTELSTPAQMLDAARLALGEAKTMGRNRVMVAS